MKLHWTEWLVVTAVVGVACMAVYAAMARAMRRAVAEKQRETERQLSAMATTLNALQARVAELGGLNAMPAPWGGSASDSIPAKNEGGQKQKSPEPEIVAVLTAAASTPTTRTMLGFLTSTATASASTSGSTTLAARSARSFNRRLCTSG